MDIVKTLKERLEKAARSCGYEAEHVPLEHPADLGNGDFATGIALKLSKSAGQPPRAIAEKIVSEFGGISEVARIEIAGPGFINFYLAPQIFAQTAQKADASPEKWGRNDLNKDKKVMVEYTDPNPFKEFHIGHLMGNAIGESISRLLEFSGAEVKRANYQGDVGLHVAKAIWGIRKLALDPHDSAQLGKAYAAGARAYENDVSAKGEIDALNQALYGKRDAETNAIYDSGRKTSLEHFEYIYQILGTKFDYYFFESETAPRGVALVKKHPEVFEASDGATVYKGEEKGLHTRVFLTSSGLPTYEAKDLGLAEMKAEKWDFDRSITVTANEQKEYFQVILAAMKDVLPDIAEKTEHITHGMMRLPGGKMSSRTGDVITGESLLEELIEAAKVRAMESRAEDHTKLAQDIAVAAIKYQVLKQASGRDIVFDRERALSLEGDSGPYLQYAHARANAILEKASGSGVQPETDERAEPNEVARLLPRFPETVEKAAMEREPHILTNYLLEFATAFNRWYASEQIIDGTANAPHKVALTAAVRSTLKNGLWLLGIPAPEKM